MKLKTGRHTSALKAARQSRNRRLINRIIRSQIKTATKKFKVALSEKNTGKAGELLRFVSSIIDKASKKKIMHRKTASRKISHLSRMLTAGTK